MSAFTSIANNPLLQTTRIIKVINAFETNSVDHVLAKDIPFRAVNTNRVAVDEKKSRGGMTQSAVPNAESPTIAFGGVNQWEFTPAEWREKVLLLPGEIQHLRELGTKDQVQSIATIIADILKRLRMRVENRMEWLRWQMLLGSLSHQNGTTPYQINYGIPADMRPTLVGTDLWDNAASDPLDDMLEWNMLYRDIMPVQDHYMFNSKCEKVLMVNAKIRAIRDSLFVGQSNLGLCTPGNLAAVLMSYGGHPYKVFDGGYTDSLEVVSGGAASSTSVVLRDMPEGINPGQSVNIVHVNGSKVARERVSVTAVNQVTKTLTLAAPGIQYASGYPAGSQINFKSYFIPDTKFIIRGRMPSNTEGGTEWGEIIGTTHVYGENPAQPASGIFGKVVVRDTDDPPRMEIIAGFNGLPVNYYQDVNLVATVHS